MKKILNIVLICILVIVISGCVDRPEPVFYIENVYSDEGTERFK